MIWISKRWDADWVSSSWYGKNGGYVRWAKKYNVKQFAESILFLQQHDIHDKETLDALVDGSSAKYHELMKTIKDAEEKMAANKVIKTHIINYAKTRETYIAYRKSGYSKKFFEAHRDEITLHKAAKEAFSAYLDETSLDSRQIYFVNQIIEYIVHNGMMKDLSVLQGPPFTDQGSIVEVFTDPSLWRAIQGVIDRINANAVA